MKKTEFMNGACFGYYDETFEECLKCKGKEPCQKASSSEKKDEVRAVAKKSTKALRELLEAWR